MQAILEVKNIKKSFAKSIALKNAEIRAYPGKVNVLMGENGAGKSTIMNIISGNLKPESGEIFFEGQKINVFNLKKSQKLGIAIVHQEIKLVDTLTVAENIFLGREIKYKSGIINYSQMNLLAQEIIDQLDASINVKTKAKNLSIAQKQLVEISKALSQKNKVLIFDEPTSSIGVKETKNLFKIIEKLKKQNIAILYITHRMEELAKIADFVTIFRDGEFIIEEKYQKISDEKIVELMVGRKLENFLPTKKTIEKKRTLIKVENIYNQYVKNINFEIKSGEILCFAGLVGAKRTELFKSLLGFYKIDSGNIYLNNKKIIFNHPANAIKNKIYYVSEDRKNEGLFLDKSISFNNSISSINFVSYFKGLLINLQKEKAVSEAISFKLKIKMNSVKQFVKNLSGGNQQKVSIAKALLTEPNIIIFDEPTRGVDVGARKEIYEIINQLKNDNKAIVIISSDLAEVIAMYDRLIVMNQGQIIIDTYQKLNQQQIMNYALNFKGGKND
ncbi:sugar ABC transporter ATP-binding protein [Mycoplasma iguanae]|uniref:Sugar ABC transporter ATP-binding protein n=1 Tax=Mycoplasma iguanae TaxID=292461 RepID=A0ABY5R9W9_9MOLU|nr:sugar ABC transporter ATP-binding protein [Mycoplasma iguanae]UVD81562.1 sugar ABC transporter ATP-binding protein [Mycoplasma iguanae]